MGTPKTGKASMIVLAILVVLGATFAPGGLRAQPSPAQSSAATEPTVMEAGTARCEGMAEGRTHEAVAGRGYAVHQAWARSFLAALGFEQPSRQSPAINPGAMRAHAQWALLLRECLLQPDDLLVHAVVPPAVSLNRVSHIARDLYSQRRGVRHE